MSTSDLLALMQDVPGGDASSMIPLLQKVQETFGYLSREAVEAIAAHLHVSPAAVYGVASFYNQFRFSAPGRCHIQVCRGTACHVKGSLNVLETLQRELGILPGQTTRDGAFSLETVACVGACSLAPVVVANGEFHAGVDNEKALRLIERSNQQVTSCND